MIEQLEIYFRMFFAVTVLTVVSDVKDFIFIVVIVTALNWLAGYLADHRKGKPYQHKKTMQAVKELFLTSAILFFVALTCNMLEPGIDYRILIKGLTGIFLIIYARNITKNLCIIRIRTYPFIARKATGSSGCRCGRCGGRRSRR